MGGLRHIAITIPQAEIGTIREAALKPLEESAEIFGAWQKVDTCYREVSQDARSLVCDCYKYRDKCFLKDDLADEIADCIQACVNLAGRYDIDLQAAIDRCEKRNRERWRY